MIRALITLCLTLAFVGLPVAAAQAAIPPDVVKAYRAYETAMTEGKIDVARTAARIAWERAEAKMGDTKTTGDLANNYASLLTGDVEKEQLKAASRAMELVTDYGADAPLVYLERGIVRLTLLGVFDDNWKRLKEGEDLVEYAEASGLSGSTFTAEIMTMVAGAHAGRGNADKAVDYAERALTVFENATDGIESGYKIRAQLYRGYGHEYEQNYMDAALSYQEVMEATDGLDPEKYPLVGAALGRWIYMRSALYDQGDLDEAEQNGLCQCWPYDKARNESVKPIHRVPPIMPRRAQQSGYVVVEFDLTDDGKPTNKRVVTAWPEYFEKPALKAVEKWQYSPRTADEDMSDRTDIVTTIRFVLSDGSGNTIW
ncbi:energy transducer TonB [Algimonas porphyrae]|uniref:TonB C-terminal domain-containing protein n=1 Tax=Algimonas porphyrae TaxID=1128113 RepID=A0ABQ5UZQ1_9PROT|nr:energy transducer TonB [Algimonas porphyrae]GLQ20245.1 hypothetical protein GCM10007854_12000 [Algimonas porphyrae]